MKKFTSVLFLSLIISSQAFAQTFTAKTNRSEIPAGELFVLSLTYHGGPTSDEPDLSPLNNGLTVFSTSSSVSTISASGNMNTTRKWDVSLISDKVDGEIRIPPLKLGNLTSNPVSVKINNNPAPQEANNNVPQYSVYTEVDNKEPFVQQQIKYGIIIEDTGNLRLAAPAFGEDIKNEWIVKPLSAPVVSTKTEAGKTVREIRYEFAIFPQKSGQINMPQVRIDGYYLTPGKRGSTAFNSFIQNEFGDFSDAFPDIFAQKNPVMLGNKIETINVKPIPNINGMSWWLPAKDVKIVSKWEASPADFKVGEAIGRTIEIEATGVVEAQIPNIDFAQIDGIKQYPEKPILNSGIKDGDIVSTARISNVYIPAKAGAFKIQPIEVSWFDTRTNRVEKAFLDEIEINVKENGSYIFDEPAESIPTYNQSTNIVESSAPADNKSVNYLFAVAAFLGGMLVSFFIFRTKKTKPVEEDKTIKENHKKSIITASQKSDFKSLRDELIKWAADRYKDDRILNLKDINKHTKNKDFEKFLETISASLYSNNKPDWNSKKFIEAFEKECSNRVIISPNTPILPNLYKD